MKEYLTEQMERTHTWLSFAEAKNAALLAFNISIIAVIKETRGEEKTPIILIIMFLASIAICLYSFYPKMNDKPVRNKTTPTSLNLFFYGDIACIDSAEEYIKAARNMYYETLSDKDVLIKQNRDLADEIIINSQIAVRKYRLFKYGLILDCGAILLGLISLIIA